jgi:ATP-binding cassette subfamily B protein
MTRRFFVPEVIQSSALDCGPASLKALFGGFGLYLSYGRLREACQTDIDGTSIDTLESVASALGLDVEQRMVPADLLLLETSGCVPAIVVVRLPDGGAHFVVLWRVHGPFVQVMDPAAGRLWMPRRTFLDSLYIHEQAVPTAAWTEWSESDAFTVALDTRLRGLKVDPELWIARAQGAGHRAQLDASLRLAHTLVEGDLMHRGIEAQEFLALCAANPAQIPAEYWTARPVPSATDRVRVRGAVLLAARSPKAEVTVASLPPSLAAVRSEAPPRVWAPLWEAVRENSRLLPAAIALGLLAAAAGTVFEALLFGGLLDLAHHLTLSGQRLAAFSMAVGLVGGLLALEWPAVLGLLSLGRQLELRLRTRFLFKIPWLSDRYLSSRLISDMAFRVHSLQLLRELPDVMGQFVRVAASLLMTTLAIAWLYPGTAVPVVVAGCLAVGVPLAFQPLLVERELRVRELSASLSRFYLDALVGSRAIQAHGAARTLRVAQLPQLARWAAAGLRQQALVVRGEATQTALSFAAIIWLVYGYAARAQTPAALLLLIYWALSIPWLGRQLALLVWNLPAIRNTSLRLLEPLGSPEDAAGTAEAAPFTRAVRVDVEDVTAIAAGHVILDHVSLRLAPGEHVAVVGRSGAGKSSLVGLLLGWQQPAQGRVLVDRQPLDANRLAHLRRVAAWIDPEVHLFHATLFENLRYGNSDDDALDRIGAAVSDADTGIVGLLQRLPDGLQTSLGERGTLVSGGEGQRVRMGRALTRSDVRLAILDEPARGLDRPERSRFLARAREHFAGATLLAVSHDISDTLAFDRVLVIERGRIVEDGSPRELSAHSTSRYRALLDEERLVQRDLWRHPRWRRFQMKDGVVTAAAEEREWILA